MSFCRRDVKKYSVSIRGHATSFSLEPEFWEALGAAARGKNISVQKLVEAIDAGRADKTNLSSALRVWLLAEASAQSAGLL
ncbi:MAG: ribbon-helix-helix domain-containing protein [Rickettsiales bacterium]|nr:ribbon-helix-helix domain-containing protein [Rickettsiales bacterium]